MADEAKAVAARKTGWKPEANAGQRNSHPHVLPKGATRRLAESLTREDDVEGLADALVKAIESLQPAKVGFASDTEPSEVYNRRWFLKPGTMDRNPFDALDQVRTNAPRDHLLKPAGPTDPEVCIVDVRTRRGRPLGLIANYALHYVGGIPKVTEEDGRVVGMASADYFGEFARIMPYRIGGSNPPADFVAMMTNGASGDINNIDFDRKRPPRAPFEQIRIVAGKTADAAWRAVKKIDQYDDDPIIAMRQREVTLKYRIPTQAEVDNANRLLKLSREEREAINRRTTQYAKSTLRMADPEHPKTEECHRSSDPYWRPGDRLDAV